MPKARKVTSKMSISKSKRYRNTTSYYDDDDDDDNDNDTDMYTDGGPTNDSEVDDNDDDDDENDDDEDLDDENDDEFTDITKIVDDDDDNDDEDDDDNVEDDGNDGDGNGNDDGEYSLNTNMEPDIGIGIAKRVANYQRPRRNRKQQQEPTLGSPHFLTNKLRIQNISQRKNIYDYQLRDHFLNIDSLRQLKCECPNHKHNKLPCNIVTIPCCPKCKTPTSEVISFQSLLFHPELISKNLMSCCTHVHTPPCRRCINCQTNLPCVVTEPFECSVSTDIVCHLDNQKFTKSKTPETARVYQHIYNTKSPVFYFCFVHTHYHHKFPSISCCIQTFKCCDSAVLVNEFNECFVVTILGPDAENHHRSSICGQNVSTNNLRRKSNIIAQSLTTENQTQSPASSRRIGSISANNGSTCGSTTISRKTCDKIPKGKEYIIFDPRIWREQSYNHFMSFIRAVITTPQAILERYKRFELSNFSISNIKKYISGKESIIRRSITGYETNGIYQTSTISCLIPYHSVVLPQNLYDLLESEDYDLDLIMVKRDPSILPTCMYVCSVIRNPDPKIICTTISDQQSKGFNQDQDGDRNAEYFIRRKCNGYDTTKSFDYKIAKLELAQAFRCKRTLIGTPRYWLSETSLLKIARFPEYFMDDPFFYKTHKYNSLFMNEASAGYLSDEYDAFQRKIIQHNLTEKSQYITVADVLLQTSKLPSIVRSGAKGNAELIRMLLDNIGSSKRITLNDRKTEMLTLCNKYITSSQDLSRNGRKQFAALYAAHDLVSLFSNIYINKCCYANYTEFASAGTLLFNESSLELFLLDLIEV